MTQHFLDENTQSCPVFLLPKLSDFLFFFIPISAVPYNGHSLLSLFTINVTKILCKVASY